MKISRRTLVLFLTALASSGLNAQSQSPPQPSITSPPELTFQARLLGDSHEFHTGEPIEIEISYLSGSASKFQTSRMNPNPDLGGVAPHLSSMEGVTNLSVLRRDPDGGFAGSFLSGGPEFLKSEPITERVNLSAWYRFQKPGHYSVTVTSNTVWRIKSVEEGGGRENIDLESNAVEFDILPHSAEWDAAELANIQQALDTVKNTGERLAPIQRMAYLDTPAAIQNIVSIFLRSANDSEGWLIYTGLRESSQADLIIPLLQESLTDPSVTVPPQLTEILAVLQTRKDLGVQGSVPSEPAERAVWDTKLKEWHKVHDNYFARDNALLVSGIQLRTGPARAKAIYQVWENAERLNRSTQQPSDFLVRLRQEALNVERELEPYQRLQLVTASLKTVPHEKLLPIIRELTSATGPDAWSYVHSAYELWCKDEKTECSSDILRRAAKSDPLMSQHEIYLVPESEHPELDKVLQEKLADAKFVWGGASSVNLSALVLRAGSKLLVPAVTDTLDQYAATRKFECEPQAHLLGYLFRFAPKDATSRLSTIIQASADPCGNQMLRFLEIARYSDSLIAIAIQGLNSPNISAAGSSATFLGTRAPESAKAALWGRLDSLRHDWHDRAAELQSNSYSWGNSPLELTARLEQALASALVNAPNWKLSDAERDRLRSGCMTDQCRTIADGKMRIGM